MDKHDQENIPRRCPGSDLPVRSDGSCDRCLRPNVGGKWRPTEFARHLGFAVLPAMSYQVAVEHIVLDDGDANE